MIDLDKFATVDEIDVEIKGPDRRTPIGLTIRIAGPDSDRQRKAADAITNERLADENAAPLTADDIRKRTIEVLAKATVSWSPDVKVGGEDLQCSEANARLVYEMYPFILEQVRAKAENRAAFIKG